MMSPAGLSQLERDFTSDLSGRAEKGLLRDPYLVESPAGPTIRIARKTYLNFSSNNYLGLASHSIVLNAAARALRRWGAGSGASRLVSGGLRVHEDLEKAIARFKGEESAAVFSSGYLANLGCVSLLASEQDVVIVDRFNHASLIDAARLSGAKLWVYPHLDLDRLAEILDRAKGFRRRIVLTDGYFSMDGDLAPLDRLLDLCEKKQALLAVDEAHSTGVFGEGGRGLTHHFNLAGRVPAVIGTLSKALGSVGGFVVGGKLLRASIINRAKPFIYTTAPCPAASGAALSALRIIEQRPSRVRDLWKKITFVRNELLKLGLDLGRSQGPIIPIVIGDTQRTLRLRDALLKEGIFAPAIRPPTVPAGTDRVRISVIASHSYDHLARLVSALKKAKGI